MRAALCGSDSPQVAKLDRGWFLYVLRGLRYRLARVGYDPEGSTGLAGRVPASSL